MIYRLVSGVALASVLILGVGSEIVETKPPCGKGKQVSLAAMSRSITPMVGTVARTVTVLLVGFATIEG